MAVLVGDHGVIDLPKHYVSGDPGARHTPRTVDSIVVLPRSELLQSPISGACAKESGLKHLLGAKE